MIWGNKYLHIGILFIVSLIQFGNTFEHEYCWDDKIVILENDRVLDGLDDVGSFFKNYKSDLRQDKYGYRPISLISFATDVEFAGLDPSYSHKVNVFLYALLCVILYILLQSLIHQLERFIAFIIVLLFLVHPTHVEVVANIKSRDEILVFIFGAMSCVQLIKMITEGVWYRYLLFGIFALLAILSRENAIVFIPIWIFIAIYKVENKKKLLKILTITTSVAIILLFVIFQAQTNSTGAERSEGLGLYHESGILGNSLFFEASLFTKLANAFYLMLLYIKNFLYPYDLVYYYGYNQIEVVGWNSVLVWMSVLIHTGLVYLAYRWFKDKPLFTFGFLTYLFGIIIYLHLYRTLADTMADRFLFISSFGLCIMLVIGIQTALNWIKDKLGKSNEKNTRITGAVVTVIILFFAVETHSRNKVWKNDLTLVQSDIDKLDNCARAHYYLATNLNMSLQKQYDAKTEDLMIKSYRRSIAISDSIYYGRLELGLYYQNKNMIDSALSLYLEMDTLFPNTADPSYYISNVFYSISKYELAEKYAEKAIRLSPMQHDSYLILALATSATGNYEKALTIADEAISKFPDMRSYLYPAYGQIYFDQGDINESITHTYKLLEYGHSKQSVYSTIIGRCQVLNEHSLADKYYKQALEQGVQF